MPKYSTFGRFAAYYQLKSEDLSTRAQKVWVIKEIQSPRDNSAPLKICLFLICSFSFEFPEQLLRSCSSSFVTIYKVCVLAS